MRGRPVHCHEGESLPSAVTLTQCPLFQNCAGQIKKLVFTQFIRECRNTMAMLQLGISLESILSREPPSVAVRPKKPRKVKKNQTKQDQDKQAQEKRVPVQKPKPRSRPGSPRSGVQRGGSNTHQNGRGGKRGGPSRIQANNP